jgi:hypothetical protein
MSRPSDEILKKTHGSILDWMYPDSTMKDERTSYHLFPDAPSTVTSIVPFGFVPFPPRAISHKGGRGIPSSNHMDSIHQHTPGDREGLTCSRTETSQTEPRTILASHHINLDRPVDLVSDQ